MQMSIVDFYYLTKVFMRDYGIITFIKGYIGVYHGKCNEGIRG